MPFVGGLFSALKNAVICFSCSKKLSINSSRRSFDLLYCPFSASLHAGTLMARNFVVISWTRFAHSSVHWSEERTLIFGNVRLLRFVEAAEELEVEVDAGVAGVAGDAGDAGDAGGAVSMLVVSAACELSTLNKSVPVSFGVAVTAPACMAACVRFRDCL